MAAVVARDPAAMRAWLQGTLRVTNDQMRDGLGLAGFDCLASLQTQNVDDYAKRCCDLVRKGPGNQAARKSVNSNTSGRRHEEVSLDGQVL